MRARSLLALFPAVISLAGCELVSGLSDLEKDESFDPDAETSVADSTASGETSPGSDTAAVDDTAAAGDTTTTPMDTSTPMDMGGSCTEPGGKTYNGKCYWPLTTNMSWDDAKTACAAKGGTLAVITSMGENEALKSIDAMAERWIGLSGTGTDKTTYKWVNGEAVSFDAWMTGEPTEMGAACVRMRPDGLWYDRPCDTATTAGIHALCEK